MDFILSSLLLVAVGVAVYVFITDRDLTDAQGGSEPDASEGDDNPSIQP